MTKAEALTIFKEYINDTTLTSTTFLEQSMLHLNNFFGEKFFDESLTTTIATNSINELAGTKRIDFIYIDDEEIPKLSNRENRNNLIEEGVQKWEHKNGKIYFLQNFVQSGLKIGIQGVKNFELPDVGDSNIEDNLQDLLFLGAMQRYYQWLLGVIMKNREDNPDTTPGEIRQTIKELRKEYADRLKLVIKGRSHE